MAVLKYKSKYLNMETDFEPLSQMPIYKFNELQIINNLDNETIRIDGTSFVVSFATNYSHALLDVIGAYYQFKKIYKNLNIIFIDDNVELKLKTYINLPLREFAKSNRFQIIDLKLYNYEFERAIIHDYFFSPIETPYTISDNDNIQKIFYSNSIKNIMQTIPDKSLSGSRKIFVSRKFANKNKKLSNNRHMAKFYTYDERYDIELENYFEKLGFEIVELEDYNLSDQIKMFSNCSIIAGVEGTTLMNSIWLPKNSLVFKIKIFEIDFSWENIFNAAEIFNIKTCNVVGMNTSDGLEKIFNEYESVNH